jgi:hypothetical protein
VVTSTDKAETYEALTYDMTIEELVRKGYPKELAALRYDISFPVRGLFFDKVRHRCPYRIV